jgi:hypothetical protein
VVGSGERGEQRVAADVELLGGDLRGTDAVQRRQLRQDRPLGEDPWVIGAQGVGGIAEVGAQRRVVAGGGDTQPQVGPGQELRRDAHPGGDHQPAREPPLMTGKADLFLDRSSRKRCRRGVTGTEGPRTADIGRPHCGPGRGQFGGVRVDEVLGLSGQRQPGGHGRTDSASIASAARRYSPASQSLARCR